MTRGRFFCHLLIYNKERSKQVFSKRQWRFRSFSKMMVIEFSKEARLFEPEASFERFVKIHNLIL